MLFEEGAEGHMKLQPTDRVFSDPALDVVPYVAPAVHVQLVVLEHHLCAVLQVLYCRVAKTSVAW